jgi:hypothetical protein
MSPSNAASMTDDECVWSANDEVDQMLRVYGVGFRPHSAVS